MNKNILIGAGAIAVIAIGAFVWQSQGSNTAALPDTSALPQKAAAKETALPQHSVASLPQSKLGSVEKILTPTRYDRILGDRNAPVTIIEYASMTCGHCGDFHKDTLPKLQEEFISKGKVRLILRDMPWDNVAMAVSKLTRCVPGNKYYTAASGFLTDQDRWLKAGNPLTEIKAIAAEVGLPAERFDSCLNDQVLHQRIADGQAKARQVLNVNSTPTFFVNGQRLEGNRPYADFVNAINKALAN